MRQKIWVAALAAFVLGVGFAASSSANQLEKGYVELSSWVEVNGRLSHTYWASNAGFNGDLASLDSSQFFEGWNTSGEAAYTQVIAQGTAKATVDSLKAAATLSVSDPVARFDGSNWGVALLSSAWLRQDLVVGNAAVTALRFGLRIDGTMGIDQPDTQSAIWPQAQVSVFDQSLVYAKDHFSAPGAAFNDYVLTNPISVVAGTAKLDIQLNARAYLTVTEAGIGNYKIQSIFDHTMRLVEVYGFDSTGAQVELPDVQTVSGFVYQPAVMPSVPEPGQGLLLVAGLGVLGAFSFRRGRSRASS